MIRTLRLLVPGGVLAVVAAAVVVPTLTAQAGEPLPARTTTQLLADIAAARPAGLSGTLAETANLGLPALPNTAGSGTAQLSRLLTGTNTVRVWTNGPTQVRLALAGQLAETDVIRNGAQLWTYDSQRRTATHVVLPATAKPGTPSAHPPLTGQLPTTPQALAQRLLAAVTPTTLVRLGPQTVVAHRPAYDLQLVPKDATTLVGRVSIAVDGKRHVPLRVRVYARGASAPAVEVGFQNHLSFATQPASRFEFTPPPGTTVTTQQPPAGGAGQPTTGTAAPARPQLIGTGWSTIALVRGVSRPASRAPVRHDATAGLSAALLSAARPVSGAFGTGRELSSALFTVLLTSDGRLYAGAVPPGVLEATAAAHR